MKHTNSHWMCNWRVSDGPVIAKHLDTTHWSLLKEKTNFVQKELQEYDRLEAAHCQKPSDLMQKRLSEMDLRRNEESNPRLHDTVLKLPERSRDPKIYNNEYSMKARQGYRYWLTEKPKPTKFGHYSMGSKNTYFGLCSAPRS